MPVRYVKETEYRNQGSYDISYSVYYKKLPCQRAHTYSTTYIDGSVLPIVIIFPQRSHIGT